MLFLLFHLLFQVLCVYMKNKKYHYLWLWLTHAVVLPIICLHCKSQLNRKCNTA